MLGLGLDRKDQWVVEEELKKVAKNNNLTHTMIFIANYNVCAVNMSPTPFSMATQISLQDVLSVVGSPLGEKSLWALLNQAHQLLEKAIEGDFNYLLSQIAVITLSF